MDENSLADVYFEKVMTAEKGVGKELATFFWATQGKEFNVGELKSITKLYNCYGRKIVFDSILDLAIKTSEESLMNLLAYRCKKNFNEKTPQPVVYFNPADISKKLKAKGK